MANDSIKEQLKQAAVELGKVEAEYFKAKEKFDKLFDHVMSKRNGDAHDIPELQIASTIVRRLPLTERVLNAMPKGGTPIALKQLAAVVGAPSRTVSATCSNLANAQKLERAGYGLWRLKP